MNTWILYVLLVLLAAGTATAAFFLWRAKWSKKEQFDATRDLFI